MTTRQAIGIAFVTLGAGAAAVLIAEINAPIRLAGPMNLPNLPLYALLSVLSLLGVAGVVIGRPGLRMLAWLMAVAGMAVAALGLLHAFGPSPDGGRWGERFARADNVRHAIVIAAAAVMIVVGYWAARRP
jgi:hypothetical protein